MSGASEHRRRKQRKERIEKEAAEKEAEEIKRGVKNSSTRRRRRKRKQQGNTVPEPEEPTDEVEADNSEPEEEKPKRKYKGTTRKVPKDRKDVEIAKKGDFPKGTIPKKFRKTLEERFLFDLIEVLEVNQSLIIVRKSDNTWTLGLGGPIMADKMFRLSGKAYLDEVLSYEYQAHMEGWGEFSGEEKIQVASRAGTEWDEHNNPRINLLRCGDAYRKLLGIDKYKPKYNTIAARRSVRARD